MMKFFKLVIESCKAKAKVKVKVKAYPGEWIA